MATLQQQVQQHLQNTGISTDLECAKYRRVMQLEQQLNDANTAYLSSKSQHERDLQRLNDANTEIKRLTAPSEMHGQSWKAACVQVEQLQKQLDHGQVVYSKLCSQLGATRAKYEAQLEAANQKELRLQEQLTEVYAEKTRQEAQIMRLRVYVWILICAVVFLIVSGLVVWGGV